MKFQLSSNEVEKGGMIRSVWSCWEGYLMFRIDTTLWELRKTSDKDGNMGSLRDVSPSQGLLQSAIADWRLQTEEAPERAKRPSNFPYSRLCLMFWNKFFPLLNLRIKEKRHNRGWETYSKARSRHQDVKAKTWNGHKKSHKAKAPSFLLHTSQNCNIINKTVHYSWVSSLVELSDLELKFSIFLQSYTTPRAFIATQGPLPTTISDFWSMIWEYSVSSVVMLTHLREKGQVGTSDHCRVMLCDALTIVN